VPIRSADIRFQGQGFNTEVPLTQELLSARDVAGLTAAFYDRYEQLYGVSQPAVPGEIVNIRLTVLGRRRRHAATRQPASDHAPAPRGAREVNLAGGRKALAVFRRDDLASGTCIPGPCLVDQHDSTTFVRAGWNGTTDGYGNLHLQRGKGA
jgi:N-methylhydantoinase A